MTDKPVRIEFHGTHPLASVEIAACRRLHRLEGEHPELQDWSVRIDARQSHRASRFHATAQARWPSGRLVRGEGHGTDVLAALRVALNNLEGRMLAVRKPEHGFAARWLSALRRHLPGAHAR